MSDSLSLKKTIVIIISRSCQIVADCIAIGVTWFTMSQAYGVRNAAKREGSLSRVLLLDGEIIYRADMPTNLMASNVGTIYFL